jgi:hypothetical protein
MTIRAPKCLPSSSATTPRPMPIRESAALGYLAPETVRGHWTGAEFGRKFSGGCSAASYSAIRHRLWHLAPTRAAAENVATLRCEKRAAHS